MAAAAVTQPPAAPAPRLFAIPGGAATRARGAPSAPPAPAVATLDELVTGVFGAVAARRAHACVVCDDGTVRARPVAAGAGGAGRCDCCGTDYDPLSE